MTAPATLSAGLAPCGHDCDPVDLIDITDEVSNDIVLAKAIEMGVVGIGEDNDCSADADAVAELVRTLHARLKQRSQQLHHLIASKRAAQRPIAV